MEDFTKEFYKQANKVDILSSSIEEHNRYREPPKMAQTTVSKAKQWMLLYFSSKWEWAGRGPWMSRDKFNESKE